MAFFTATPNPTWPGGTLTICFTDQNRAGESVVIDVTNGLPASDPGHRSEHPQIMLGENGTGCIEWPVPLTGWAGIILEHPDADSLGVDIDTTQWHASAANSMSQDGTGDGSTNGGADRSRGDGRGEGYPELFGVGNCCDRESGDDDPRDSEGDVEGDVVA